MTSELESIITLATSQLKFGVGATEELGYELRSRASERVLLVADGHLREFQLADRVKKIIEQAGMELSVYDEVHIEPTDVSMRHAIESTQGESFDAVVALGGGSTIDTAKAINLFNQYPADLYDYINPPIGKGKPVPGALKPLIALPTTAGTGSETTPVVIMDLLDLKVKTGISHANLRPTMGLVDPLNTVSLPPAVTAYTGLDVLTHAAEAFTSKPYHTRPKPDPAKRPDYIGSNPFADLWSEQAIEWVGRYLRRAYFNGGDMEARIHMAMAATVAGIGFGNAGVHIPHALGYPIAGMVEDWMPESGFEIDEPMVPHGLAAIMTAPASFRFTAPVAPEKHARIAELLGAQITGLPPRDAAMKLPEVLIGLMKDLGCPNGLSSLGYTEQDVPAMVEGGWKQQRLLSGAPCQVTKEDLARILIESMTLW